jgi:hypothetical protein
MGRLTGMASRALSISCPATVSTVSTFSTSTFSTPVRLLLGIQRLMFLHIWRAACAYCSCTAKASFETLGMVFAVAKLIFKEAL